MIVRLARVSYAAQLAELNHEFNGSSVSVEQIIKQMNSLNSEKTVVADADGIIAGFGCLQVYGSYCYPEPWAELTELYVKPEYRRQGVGQAIVGFIEKMAVEAGATEITLLAGEQNIDGQSLYLKCGYFLQPKLSFCKKLKGGLDTNGAE